MITKNTQIADAILATLDILSGETYNLYAEPYQNGREHGWSVYNYDHSKQVAFSQYRNTDGIVIYMGRPFDFNPSGNVPADDVYNKKIFLCYDEIGQAAKSIMVFLTDGEYEG